MKLIFRRNVEKNIRGKFGQNEEMIEIRNQTQLSGNQRNSKEKKKDQRKHKLGAKRSNICIIEMTKE